MSTFDNLPDEARLAINRMVAVTEKEKKLLHKALDLMMESVNGDIAANTASIAALPTQTSGTFTPSMTIGLVNTGITYGTRAGFYKRTGDVVHFNLRLTLTSKGGLTGIVRVNDLPFTSDSTLNNSSACTIPLATTITFTEGQTLVGFIDEGDDFMAVKQYVSASNAIVDFQGSDLADTTTLYVSGTYLV